MSKRQRLDVEPARAESGAPPSVCYVPSVVGDADGRIAYNVHAKARVGAAVQLVQAALGDVEYVGRSDGDESMAVQPCCYALGVYKPGEGKLQLTSVAGERLFRLDSRLNGLLYAPTGASAEESAKDARKAAAKRLVDEFGSTRRRRQLTAREAGVVAADRISGGDAVKEMLGGVAARGEDGGLTRDEMQRRAFAQRTVPPHNPAATTAADAYPLELLLQPSSLGGEDGDDGELSASALVGELNAAQIHKLAEDDEELAKAREKDWVHSYVLSRLGPLQRLKRSEAPVDAAKAKARARYLALLAALLKLQARPVLNVKEGGAASVARELHLRDGLANFCLARFYVRTENALRGARYERPDAHKQLLLAYILAVAMVAEDGFLDKEPFEELRAALKMDAAKLALALQQVGCTTKTAKMKVERDGYTTEVSAFTAILLRQTDPAKLKTLAECFPSIKVAKAKGGGR